MSHPCGHVCTGSIDAYTRVQFKLCQYLHMFRKLPKIGLIIADRL